MAKTSGDLEQEFIKDLKSKTGKNLSTWLGILKKTGIEKNNEMIRHMKEEHGWRHMDSAFLSGILRNNGNPVYGSSDVLLENQISKYEEWRPLFSDLSERILGTIPNSEMIPKKTYVSFIRKREFAAINIKAKEIRMGLDLGDTAEEGIVQRAKLTGPMPRISSMVVFRSKEDWSDEIEELLKVSDKRVNG